MTPERWQQIKTILDGALDCASGDRDGFLARACLSDTALRSDVDDLLETESELSNFMDRPAFSLRASNRDDDAVGRRIDAYVLRQKIGHGGMGTVYLAARRDDFEKKVAIKLLRRGMESERFVQRFRFERQVLAGLEHPNIARLLDGGTTEDGLPYFVIEYVDGVPIDRYCAEQQLDLRARVRLFQQVCAAIQVAHQGLVVHRDIKPSNILVTADGTPKLLDFGIAKLLAPGESGVPTAGGMNTESGMWLMTPAFASPEQVRGEPITTASDIYALGVLLYHLLTGEKPYELPSSSPLDVARVVCEQTPIRPSAKVLRNRPVDQPRPLDAIGSRRLRGDLDAIVMKALRKEAGHRYASAERLSEDLDRYLGGYPVTARQGSTLYAAGRFLRRNRLPVAVGTAMLLLITGWGVRESITGRELVLALEDAKTERQLGQEVIDLMQGLFQGARPEAGSEVTAREVLEQGVADLEQRLYDQPALRAAVLDELGRALAALGQQGRAIEVLRSALASAEQAHGPQHPEVAVAKVHLATELGEVDAVAAEALFRDALEIQAGTLERDDTEAETARNNYATFLLRNDRYQEAIPLLEEVLASRSARLPAEAEQVTTVRGNLATAYQQVGDFVRAEQMYREEVQARRRSLAPDHPDLAVALNNLATVLHPRGRYEEARALLEESLTIRRAAYDQDDPRVTRTLNNLAAVAHDAGDVEAAVGVYREALSLAEQRWGAEHVSVGLFANNLAVALIDQEEYDEAAGLLADAEVRVRAQWPDGHHIIGAVVRNQARLALGRGQSVEAEDLVQQAMAVFEVQLPSDHWRMLDAQCVLAAVMASRGRTDEARSLVARALPRLEEALGPHARLVREARQFQDGMGRQVGASAVGGRRSKST